jgi:nucleotide-binding universal stress UspA family protein
VSSSSTSPTVIVAAVEDGPSATEVIRTAARLGQSLGNVELHLLQIVEPSIAALGPEAACVAGRVPSESEATVEARDRVVGAARLARSFFDTSRGSIVSHVAFGPAAAGILELAERLRADVIVVGSHGKKRVARWITGSVSEQVVRKASCPVLVARAKNYPIERRTMS